MSMSMSVGTCLWCSFSFFDYSMDWSTWKWCSLSMYATYTAVHWTEVHSLCSTWHCLWCPWIVTLAWSIHCVRLVNWDLHSVFHLSTHLWKTVEQSFTMTIHLLQIRLYIITRIVFPWTITIKKHLKFYLS